MSGKGGVKWSEDVKYKRSRSLRESRFERYELPLPVVQMRKTTKRLLTGNELSVLLGICHRSIDTARNPKRRN